MSPELIETVARESEAIRDKHTFRRFADTRRLKWAGGLIGVPMLARRPDAPPLRADAVQGAAPAATAGVGRDSADQPAGEQHPGLWPAGDEVTVEYIVSGKIGETRPARLRVKPDDLPADEYKLEFARRLDDDRTVFAARVPHSSVNFTHRAWVGDGRTQRRVRRQVRAAAGRHPDRCLGPVAEVPRRQAGRQAVRDLPVAGRDHRARELRSPACGSPCRSRSPRRRSRSSPAPRTGPANTRRRRDRDVHRRGRRRARPARQSTRAEVSFDLTPDLIAYQVEVKDLNGFANSTPPRRGIQIAPDDPPSSACCRSAMPSRAPRPSDEDIIEGLADPDRRADPDRLHLPIAARGRSGAAAVPRQRTRAVGAAAAQDRGRGGEDGARSTRTRGHVRQRRVRPAGRVPPGPVARPRHARPTT